VYPLDKHRKLLEERTKIDPVTGNKTVLKTLRLFTDDGDWTDIEVEEHIPNEVMLRTQDSKKRIISQHSSGTGHLNKLLVDDSGQVKEFFVEEKASSKKSSIPASKRQKVEEKTDELSIEFMKLLLTTKVDDLTPQNKMIFVAYRNESAMEVFKGLVRHQFLSCPVLNKSNQMNYGFLDLMDYINYFVGQIAEKTDMTHPPGNDLWELLNKQSDFSNKRVKDIMVSERLLFHPIRRGYSLYSAVEALAKEPHLHRVPIVDDDNRLINVITQSQIIDLVANNINLLGSKKNKKLSEIPQLFHDVIKIRDTDVALEAFKLIHNSRVTGVAIVDMNNKLVGNISTKDLRGIDLDGKWFSRMFLSAQQYLKDMINTFPELSRPNNPIFVKGNDTIETAIKLIHQNKIHRIYIVDDNLVPVGIIGLKDILQQIVCV